MAQAAYFLGIDVSTTATKALLIDQQGEVTAVASTEYGFETTHPLWSEQDPALWWQGTLSGVRAVLAQAGIPGSAVQGIGLTGQMHGLVLLDEAGQVLRPSILWNDQRTAAEVRRNSPQVGESPPDPADRQRRSDRLHRAQNPVGARK